MTEDITKFYNEQPNKEWSRLDDPYNSFELVATLKVIDTYFENKGRVCDIGSGPGRYAIELLQRGHDVTLVDFSVELLETAKVEVEKRRLAEGANFICSDARKLERVESNTYDYVMLMGPMYHLHELDERQKALREAKRVLKPGGLAIVAYLNSWGIIRYGLERFSKLYKDDAFLRSFIGDVSIDWQFQNFTEWFSTTPPMMIKELESVGFEVVHQVGCEAFASGMKPAIRRIAEEHPEAYQNILKFIPEAAAMPQYRDVAEHVHFLVS
ncbi:MAG: class I SAM-dependent methyltransferase [Chlamydiota bacterium]